MNRKSPDCHEAGCVGLRNLSQALLIERPPVPWQKCPLSRNVTFVRRCCAWYLCALLGFWAFAVGEKYVRYQWGHKQFSASSMFFAGGKDRFRDFLNFDPVTERFSSTASLAPVQYPAPLMFVYTVFTRSSAEPLHTFLAFIVITALGGALVLARSLFSSTANRWRLTGAAGLSLVFSYPLLTVFERANMEAVVWAVLALAFGAFVTRHHTTAAILFALAASMKVFPAVLLLLLLARRRYREFAVSLISLAGFTVAALRALDPSMPAALKEISAGMAQQGMSYKPASLAYDHSLFGALKQILFLHYRDELDGSVIAAWALPYLIAAVCGFAALYWFRIRKLPLLNQISALLILAVTLPFTSAEYTLNHLYFAWSLILLFLARDVTSGRESIPWPAITGILLCFAFLFAPPPFNRFGGPLKACALVVLLFITCAVPMRSALLEQDDLVEPPLREPEHSATSPGQVTTAAPAVTW